MLRNDVLDLIMNRGSIRSYTDEEPSDEVIEAIVRAGQQAPFAGQLGSLLLSRNRGENPFGAPLLFTVCVDVNRLELVMRKRGWERATSDPAILLFGIQDAAYMAENMVIAAASLGLGSCFLGAAPFHAERIIEEYSLPPRVFPLVQLAIGYPAEVPPPRPRYPLEFTLFEDHYPDFDRTAIEEAARVMDEGYLAQDYYRKAGYMVPIEDGRPEPLTFDRYSWSEHMGRKWGQWLKDPADLLGPLAKCGFRIEKGDGAP